LSGIVALEAGSLHTCALRVDGKVFCWGDNSNGQLGDGTTFDSHAATAKPVQAIVAVELGLVDLTNVVALGVGQQHSCALRVDGQPLCWGSDVNGQLGTTAGHGSALPVPSFTFNIDPNVTLKNNQRVAVVNALANCPAGDQVHLEVQLTQGGSFGQGHGEGTCTGALSNYPVTVPAHGPAGFQPGAAEAQADAVVRDHGKVVDTEEWTRQVELSFNP